VETDLGIEVPWGTRVNFNDSKTRESVSKRIHDACLRFNGGYFNSLSELHNTFEFPNHFFIEFHRFENFLDEIFFP
jgi:hypothetical protein